MKNILLLLAAVSLMLSCKDNVTESSKIGISIGTIVYNLDDIDARFKELSDAGFSSCEIHYRSDKCTSELAAESNTPISSP